MVVRTRSSRFSSPEVQNDEESSPLVKLSHGWYTEETLFTVLGEEHALNLLQNVRKGSQDGYVIISDKAREKYGNDRTTVYYIRYPELCTFEPIRVSACEWMKACREIDAVFLDLFTLGSFNSEVINVESGDYLLRFILRYAGLPESDYIPRQDFNNILLGLLHNCKLHGVPDPQSEPNTPMTDMSDVSDMSFPSSAGGYAPKDLDVGPFVEMCKRARESGKFKKTNPYLSLFLGQMRASLPQEGDSAVLFTMANVLQACEMEIENAFAEQHNMYFNVNLAGMVPKSSDALEIGTRMFASHVLLKFVRGVIESGGWVSMSVDGGERMTKNLFPCKASFFNSRSSPPRVEFSIVTCGDDGSSGLGAARIMLHAFARMQLMRECLVEEKVLEESCSELKLGHVTADGGPDMQSTLTGAISYELGYDVPVIHCFMHTHSLILQDAYAECFDEGHQPDLERPGVMSLLNCISWMLSSQYPAEQRTRLLKLVFREEGDNDSTMHESTEAALEEINFEEAKDSLEEPQAYAAMFTRWSSFERVLTQVVANWEEVRESMGGISGCETGTVSKIALKVAKWMQDPGLRIQCQFVNTFCELWYNPWYHCLFSDAPTATKYSERDLVAGFRCGEMAMFCAAMEVELKDVTEVLKTVLEDSEAVLEPSQGTDGTLGSRPAMHEFKVTWNGYVSNAPEEHVTHLVKCFNCFLETAMESFAKYNKQWFTKYFYMAVDDPNEVVASYVTGAVRLVSKFYEDILSLESDRVEQRAALIQQCRNGLEVCLVPVPSANIKLWSWSPQHNLKTLLSVLVGHLVEWFKDLCAYDTDNQQRSKKRKHTSDSKLLLSPWPVVDNILATKRYDEFCKELLNAVRATQHHNQLSEMNVGNAGHAIRGKKSFSSANQSDLIICTTALEHEKHQATRKLALEKRESGERLPSESATSSVALMKILEQQEIDTPTELEVNAMELYLKRLKELPDPLEPSPENNDVVATTRLKRNRQEARTVEPVRDVACLTAKKHTN